MITKRSVWFMTLFSLIITLSVYYITVPSEKELGNSPVVKAEESTILTALRVESDKEMESLMNDLRFIIIFIYIIFIIYERININIFYMTFLISIYIHKICSNNTF